MFNQWIPAKLTSLLGRLSARKTSPQAGSPEFHALHRVEDLVIQKTNARRLEQNLPCLNREEILRSLARAHCADMLKQNFFHHENPDGLGPGARVAKGHRQLVGVVGENIWTGSGYDHNNTDQLSDKIVTSWMLSPGHRKNILTSAYTHLGIGVVERHGTLIATQLFAEVFAWLEPPLPDRVPRGQVLILQSRIRKIEKFDFWSRQQGKKIAGPFPSNSGLVDRSMPTGCYTVRCYFPVADNRYVIWDGPEIRLD